MKDTIKKVYEMLKDRKIHPSGEFDAKGRWYAANEDLIDVRQPSAKWPYSHMTACRTKKYVEAVCKKYGCKTEEEIIKYV